MAKKNNIEGVKSELGGMSFFPQKNVDKLTKDQVVDPTRVEPNEYTNSVHERTNDIDKRTGSSNDDKQLTNYMSFFPTKRTRSGVKQAIESLQERLAGKRYKVTNSDVINFLIEEGDLLSDETQEKLYQRIKDKILRDW